MKKILALMGAVLLLSVSARAVEVLSLIHI